MLEVSKIAVTGWEPAIRGMRNPYKSWDKSDSVFKSAGDECGMSLGSNNLALMLTLIKGGSEHRKFLRMVTVTMDIKAPLYWWKEFDTYKVGTVVNSESTMHTLHRRDLDLSDFSIDHLTDSNIDVLQVIIHQINVHRGRYCIHKDKTDWWQMVQLLPTSFNQTRTVQLNYEVALSIIHQRTGHRLTEWTALIDTLIRLPLMEEFTGALREKVTK